MVDSRRYFSSKKYIEGKYPRNFSRAELIHSDTAEARGISNEPINTLIGNNIINLAHFLQEIRDCIERETGVQRSISLSSGYRCPALNKMVGGSYASDHMRGAAADITVHGWTAFQTAQFIIDNMPDLKFGQLINEYGKWVHISLGSNNKVGDVRTAVRRVINGREKTVYDHGNFDY